MQFFGARVNLPKTLLYAINGGRDEMTGEQIGPMTAPITGRRAGLRRGVGRFDAMMEWLAETYVNALNVIHYMHDKYCYEAVADGAARSGRPAHAGVRHRRAVAHGRQPVRDQVRKVKPVRDETGLVVDYETEGEFPRYGNNDDRVDQHRGDAGVDDDAARSATTRPTATRKHTQSVLTITSNVVYGKQTGNSPDGRRQGVPFAPGANPSNGADSTAGWPRMLSVAKLPYDDAEDGISLTISVVPTSLGTEEERITRAVGGLDAYFPRTASTSI